eukprot:scaffold660143_cov64-Prasinocladus_malaysianus.AAC.1
MDGSELLAPQKKSPAIGQQSVSLPYYPCLQPDQQGCHIRRLQLHFTVDVQITRDIDQMLFICSGSEDANRMP